MIERLEELRAQLDAVDEQIAHLFEKRMEICGEIGLKKREMGAEVLDSTREAKVLSSRAAYLENEKFLPYWTELVKCLMKVSKDYQWILREGCPSLKK